MPIPNTPHQCISNLEKLLELLNIFELKKELDQPIAPITSLSDLQRNTEQTLFILSEAFAEVSELCSHWTINSLFGSSLIGSYLEKLVHQVNKQLTASNKLQETSDKWKIGKFGHSFVAEIAVGMSLNSLVILASIDPVLTSLGIISAAFLETSVNHTLNILSVQSFSSFTILIRQRLTEYPEFRDFFPEYKMYTNVLKADSDRVYDLSIVNYEDIFKVFKLIHTFDRVKNRRDLLEKLIIILSHDKVFQHRLQQKYSRLGVVFFQLLSGVSEMGKDEGKMMNDE